MRKVVVSAFVAITLICLPSLVIAQSSVPTLAAPTDLKATVIDGAIRLTWVDASAGEDGFVIERSETADMAETEVFDLDRDVTEWTDRTAQPNRAYYYQVYSKAGTKRARASGTPVRAVSKGDFKLLQPKKNAKDVITLPTIKWQPSPGAERYEVTVRRDGVVKPEFSTTQPASAGEQVTLIDPLRQDEKYELNVTAIGADGATLDAKNGPTNFTTSDVPPWAAWLRVHHLSLKRAFDGDGASEGARFSYAKDIKRQPNDAGVLTTEHSEAANFDFALVYSVPIQEAEFTLGNSRIAPELLASIEAKLSNTDFDSQDALRFRLGAKISESPADVGDDGLTGVFDSTDTYMTLKYESDQDFDTQKLMLETLFTPTKRAWAMGQYLPEPRTDPLTDHKIFPFVQFRWRPYVGFDWGRTFDAGNSIEDEGTLFRAVARIKAKARFPKAREIGLHELALYADNTFRYVTNTSGDDIHNYLDTGVEMDFTPNFGVAFSYKIGEDSPDFLKTESLNVALTLKF